jgi:hypothetical protein
MIFGIRFGYYIRRTYYDDTRSLFLLVSPTNYFHSSYRPIEYDTPVLISTLKIATNFNHSGLRDFAIQELELKSLSPMDFIPIARELKVPQWEARALEMLVARIAPVTLEEARVIGIEAFVELVSQREKRMTRSGLKPVSLLVPSTRSSSPEIINEASDAIIPRARGRGRPPSQRIAHSARPRIVLHSAPARANHTKTSTVGMILSSRSRKTH